MRYSSEQESATNLNHYLSMDICSQCSCDSGSFWYGLLGWLLMPFIIMGSWGSWKSHVKRKRRQFSCLSQSCCHLCGTGKEMELNFRREDWLMGVDIHMDTHNNRGISLQVTAERAMRETWLRSCNKETENQRIEFQWEQERMVRILTAKKIQKWSLEETGLSMSQNQSTCDLPNTWSSLGVSTHPLSMLTRRRGSFKGWRANIRNQTGNQTQGWFFSQHIPLFI